MEVDAHLLATNRKFFKIPNSCRYGRHNDKGFWWGRASIQQVKTARKTAGGIAAKLLFYYHLPAKIHPERNGSEPDETLEQGLAAGLHNV